MTTARVRSVSFVAVGDELLAGLHPDTNSPELALRLAELGVRARSFQVVGDEEAEIERAVRRAVGMADLVLVTGGLGPTLDDVTRQGVAKALGEDLVRDEAAVEGLRRWFEASGRTMSETNLRQAWLPASAQAIENRVGTAPGFRARSGNSWVVVLPGPPAEMRVVFAEQVEPWLRETAGLSEVRRELRFHLFGLSESLFAEMAGAWMVREADPCIGCSVKRGVLSVVLRGRGADGGGERLRRRATQFRERFSPWIFSDESPDLERALAGELRAAGISVALAESCTGGLASAHLTRVPGISAVFPGAMVCYANESKVRDLGIEPGLLEAHGAVSKQVAEAMARGVAGRFGVGLGLAVTGIAGPDGGGPGKPVGTCWFASCRAGRVRSFQRRFPPGGRRWIRMLAAKTLLFEGLTRLRGQPNPTANAPSGD